MRTKTILILVFSCFITSIYAQNDSLSYKNGFYKNDVMISKRAVKELVLTDSKALASFKSAQTLEVIGYIIGYPSAFAFGYDLGYRLGGGKGNNTMLIAGGIGTSVGVLFTFLSQANYKKSIKIYNNNRAEHKNISSLNFGVTSNGEMGFTFRF